MVDIVHHTLIGGAGYLVAVEYGYELEGMAFLAANVFPDLDVIFMAFGKRFYLRHHQGITHSLVLSPLYAFGLSLPLFYLAGFNWSIVVAALTGLLLHIGLDLGNTFRIALTAPISKRRVSLDAMFFVDGIALALTAGFYLAWLIFAWKLAAWIYPVAFISYIAWKFTLQRRVRRRLACESAIPSAWNPFHFYVLERKGDVRSTYLYNALHDRRSDIDDFNLADQEARDLAESSPLFRDMREILRALEITHTERSDRGLVIEATDLAVRNFGGKFGKTRLMFDKDDRLIE